MHPDNIQIQPPRQDHDLVPPAARRRRENRDRLAMIARIAERGATHPSDEEASAALAIIREESLAGSPR
jgi:hypothetical protein